MQINPSKRALTAGASFLAAFLWMLSASSVETSAAGNDSEYSPAREHWTAAAEDATWKDTSRDREVPVRIYAPDRKHGNGPFPLVVFSHGGGESREAFTYLGTHWRRTVTSPCF